jgi:hypothetical protein
VVWTAPTNVTPSSVKTSSAAGAAAARTSRQGVSPWLPSEPEALHFGWAIRAPLLITTGTRDLLSLRLHPTATAHQHPTLTLTGLQPRRLIGGSVRRLCLG